MSGRTRTGDGVTGHVPPAPDRGRALLGVSRAAVEFAAARRRLGACIRVAEAAGATQEEIVQANQATTSADLPAWMPSGDGTASFG